MKETSITAASECSLHARRSFIKKSGVALSGALAAAVAGSAKAAPATDIANTDDLAQRLGMLEDVSVLRDVYQAYVSALNQGQYEDVLNLFAVDSEVFFGGGIFTGKDKGVRRLYMENFRQGLTGRTEPPVDMKENINIASDRKSAQAEFSYSMRVGTPMDASLQLVQMARVQGGGIEYRRESGRCEVSFVKEGGAWKIFRLEYSPV